MSSKVSCESRKVSWLSCFFHHSKWKRDPGQSEKNFQKHAECDWLTLTCRGVQWDCVCAHVHVCMQVCMCAYVCINIEAVYE